MISFTLLFVLLFSLLASADVLSNGRNCSCGFYDAQTEELFTDSIIVYFNETTSLPADFTAENYEKKYEKDWNAIYRQGADPKNVRFNGTDSLQLVVQPSTSDHLVKGGGIRTVRRDIQHGSFRTFIKSPKQTSSGSAMTMMWQYNETEVTELSVMNQNDPSQAWIGTFVTGEFTTRSLGMNFTEVQNGAASNRNYTTLGGGLSNGSVDPWDFTEYRIDWTKDYINFYIGGNLTRQVLHDKLKGMPSVPAGFNFKHWSTGNRYSMRGPPRKESVAEIGWIRMFFNSSSMPEEVREDFVARCPLTDACSMDDISLRGSTPYGEHAKKKWKQDSGKDVKRMPALWISVICIAFSTVLIVHALARRMRQSKASPPGHGPAPVTEKPEKRESYGVSTQNTLRHSSNTTGSFPILAIPGYGYQFKDDLTIEKADPSPDTSVWGGSTHGGPSRPSSVRYDSRAPTPHLMSPTGSTFNATTEELPTPKMPPHFERNQSVGRSQTTIIAEQAPERLEKIAMETVTESAMPAPRMRPQPPPPRQRIDYLAGLVALCAILVTVMHFCLSFVPAVVIPGAPQHHPSEWWAQQIVAPFILNQMWLGVFFTTSVRFLVAPYLKKGNMQDVAKAAVRRTPRLMIPVGSIALLEYFLIDCGATHYLSYIPSITWSTWPYVTRYESFGHYISAILELVYLVPNAVPQITFNYCTGVLWTIAVQLQGTWLVLCGVIVIYEIKTTWKRVCYYIFCMINHWYASSWGTYLWLGLLLTDLDITYKYKKWLYNRPLVYYPLITSCWLCVALGFSANVVSGWVDFNFSTLEYGIHPDHTTGDAIMNTEHAGYPPYFTPRLNGLLFAGGMQAVLELSPAVQWLFSLPPLLVLFPHIFTIYLIHGIVFWSWGSWLMIVIANHNISFGINVAVVGVTSYILLFASLPIITPIIEALGKDITALFWMTAVEKSPPRRKTLFPFPDDLFLKREEKGANSDLEASGSSSCSGSSGLSEKGKMRAEQVELDEINHYESKGKAKEKEKEPKSFWEAG